jgi:hypothetical protein
MRSNACRLMLLRDFLQQLGPRHIAGNRHLKANVVDEALLALHEVWSHADA